MSERDIWIDQAYAASEYRVRELLGEDVETLGVFATRPQAEDFMDRTLYPEKYAEEEVEEEPVEEAPPAPEKKKPTWTRGISPGDA